MLLAVTLPVLSVVYLRWSVMTTAVEFVRGVESEVMRRTRLVTAVVVKSERVKVTCAAKEGLAAKRHKKHKTRTFELISIFLRLLRPFCGSEGCCSAGHAMFTAAAVAVLDRNPVATMFDGVMLVVVVMASCFSPALLNCREPSKVIAPLLVGRSSIQFHCRPSNCWKRMSFGCAARRIEGTNRTFCAFCAFLRQRFFIGSFRGNEKGRPVLREHAAALWDFGGGTRTKSCR